MYPKLPPVHPKRMLLADLERKGSEFEEKDIFNKRKQYLWIRSKHAFLSVNVKFFFVGRESILFVVSAHGGSYLWVITPPPYFSHPQRGTNVFWNKFKQSRWWNLRKVQSTGRIKYRDLENKTPHYVTVWRDQNVDWYWDFFSVTKLFDTRNLKRLESGSSLEHEKLFRTWNLRNHRTPTKQPLIPWIFPNPATRHNFIWDLSFLKALDRNIVVHYSEWDGQEGQKGWVMTSHLPPTAPTTAHQLSITS